MTISTLQVSALAALLLAAGGLFYQHEQNARQADTIATLKRDADRDQGLIKSQGDALSSIQLLQRDVAAISSATRATQQALDAQSSVMGNALKELKRNDQAVRDYLNSPVPAAIGLRWKRAESTDPLTYRPAGSVRPDTVPTTGSARPGLE